MKAEGRKARLRLPALGRHRPDRRPLRPARLSRLRRRRSRPGRGGPGGRRRRDPRDDRRYDGARGVRRHPGFRRPGRRRRLPHRFRSVEAGGLGMTAVWDANLTAERATFVTHLECSMTGERYEADRLHGLSRGGRPLLVRYDLRRRARGADPARRSPRGRTDLWRWRELLPVRRRGATSSASARRRRRWWPARLRRGARRRRRCWSRTRGGCRPARSRRAAWRWRCRWRRSSASRRIAMPTNGNAGAALAAYASRAGIETIVFCPDDTPEINVREIARAGRARLSRQRPDQRLRRDRRRGREGGRLVRPVDAEGAVPDRGQEDDGAGAGRAARLASCPT